LNGFITFFRQTGGENLYYKLIEKVRGKRSCTMAQETKEKRKKIKKITTECLSMHATIEGKYFFSALWITAWQILDGKLVWSLLEWVVSLQR